MVAKIKSSVFIDALHVQVSLRGGECLRGVLKDDTGCICRTIEKEIRHEKEDLTWEGLNDLPYGRYTLELHHAGNGQEDDPVKLQLVKRV